MDGAAVSRQLLFYFIRLSSFGSQQKRLRLRIAQLFCLLGNMHLTSIHPEAQTCTREHLVGSTWLLSLLKIETRQSCSTKSQGGVKIPQQFMLLVRIFSLFCGICSSWWVINEFMCGTWFMIGVEVICRDRRVFKRWVHTARAGQGDELREQRWTELQEVSSSRG